MFEKAKPLPVRSGAFPRDNAVGGIEERFAGPATRRGGDALRALEWSELTARLNAARELRMLLRADSQAPITSAAASFGDAAASYFALLEHDELEFNLDALGQWKGDGAKMDAVDGNRPDKATGFRSDALRGATRDK